MYLDIFWFIFSFLFGLRCYLGIAELVESCLPMLATPARRLVSTEWIGWDTVVHIVELHHTALYMTSKMSKGLSVLSEYIRTESIDRIICEFYRLFESVESNNWQDWPEHFFVPNSHIGGDIPEDHRSKICPTIYL